MIVCGDCERILRGFPNDYVDLIVTSPPYANARGYCTVKPAEYVDWFLPKSKQFLRILKPTGTFILNIKERVVKGERSTYVIELVLALKEQGWLWTEEFIWHKKSSMPGKWPNRFRDAWERLLQFNVQYQFNMYQDTVIIPSKESTRKRARNLSENDKVCRPSATGSPFKRNMSNMCRDMAYPTNVLYLSPETTNKGHSAVFPIGIPEWFIQLFTTEGDTVLDPFVGSGTTLVAAWQLKRNYIGIDILEKNCRVARERLRQAGMFLPTHQSLF